MEDITPEREFSILSNSEIYKYCRIMLGPVSFVNHSCGPNCRYFVGGETKSKLVVRLECIEKIAASKELTVHYGDDYFEGIACHCECCKRDSVNQRCKGLSHPLILDTSGGELAKKIQIRNHCLSEILANEIRKPDLSLCGQIVLRYSAAS